MPVAGEYRGYTSRRPTGQTNVFKMNTVESKTQPLDPVSYTHLTLPTTAEV